MSLEEKRSTLLNLYHSMKGPVTEKELISLATKAGVSQGAILQVNDGLVSDYLVDTGKVGGSHVWWSFPAAADRKKKVKLDELNKGVEMYKRRLEKALEKLKEAKDCRCDADGSRSKKLRRLNELNISKASLNSELSILADSDPEAIDDLHKSVAMCKAAAERWTDNVLACRSYLIKRKGWDRKEADRALGITANFDYPAEK